MNRGYKFLGMVLVLILLASMSIACTSEDPGTVSKGDGAQVEETRAEEEKENRQNLSVGDSYEIADVSVTVNSIEDGGRNYEDKKLIKVNVTYVNNSDESASFNSFDWSVQDEEGARTDTEFTDKDELGSGDLAPGGKTSGDVYFIAKGASKIVYTNNWLFDGEDNLAMWNVK